MIDFVAAENERRRLGELYRTSNPDSKLESSLKLELWLLENDIEFKPDSFITSDSFIRNLKLDSPRSADRRRDFKKALNEFRLEHNGQSPANFWVFRTWYKLNGFAFIGDHGEELGLESP